MKSLVFYIAWDQTLSVDKRSGSIFWEDFVGEQQAQSFSRHRLEGTTYIDLRMLSPWEASFMTALGGLGTLYCHR